MPSFCEISEISKRAGGTASRRLNNAAEAALLNAYYTDFYIASGINCC